VDIVISSTAAPHYVLKAEHGPAIMKARRHRPLFIVDIAVPRDVDPALNELDNLYLYNVDDLQTVVDAGYAERLREAALAESLVEEEVRSYASWLRSLAVKPTIVDLRRRLHEIAESELRRHHGRLAGLNPGQEQVVADVIAGVVNKILHAPSVELKRALENPNGFDVVSTVRKLFDLGEARPDAEEVRAAPDAPAAAPEKA
jgi:glutamyl-tRNA reductase